MVAQLDELIDDVGNEAPADSAFIGTRQRAKLVVEMLEKHAPEDARILSLGSGFSHFEVLLSRLGFQIVAVDNLSYLNDDERSEAVETITRFCSQNGVEFHLDDALNLDTSIIPDDGFDFVIALDVFEHIPRPSKFLKTAKDSLNSAGHLMLLTPNGVDLAKRINVLLGRPHGVRVETLNREGPFTSHIKEYTPAELEEILQVNGFEPVEFRFFNQSAQKYDRRSDDWKTPFVRYSYELVTKVSDNLKDTQIVVTKHST